jgi:hypothetical protein
LFLFDPDNPKVKRAGKIISERLEKTLNGDIDVNSMPYEFRALEGILVNVCLSLEKDFSSLEPTILENLDDLPTKLTSRQLEELRSFKQRLSQFSARSQEVQRVIQEILEEDENMINMYLTEKSLLPRHRRNLVEHEEIEILSESYLQVIDHLVIAQTEQTPHVSFLSNGLMEISGKSIDEDSQEFWNPVVSWVKTYSLKPSTKTCLNLFIESLDTSSSTALVELLYLLKEMMKEGNEVHVHWNYEENDLDMLELGKDMEQLTQIGFEFDVLKPFPLG